MAVNQQNPFQAFNQLFQQNAFADAFKSFGEFKTPAFDVTNLVQASRRNFETVNEAGQTAVENAQAIARRQAELARAQVETVLKSSKDMLVNGSPEINTSKQIELARGVMESSLNNLREISEMVTKSGFELFDVFNRRAAEQLDELHQTAPKAARTGKKAA